MATTKAYSDMTIAELETANQKLMADKDAIRAKQRELTAQLDKKLATAEAERKLSTLSPTQKEALHQVLEAQGIESQEQVQTF